MAGDTLSNIDALLKEFYVNKIAEQVKQSFRLSDWAAERDDVPAGGREVVYPAHVGRNTGVGAIAENANLPTAGNQQWVDFKIPFKYNYGRIQLTGPVIAQTQTNKMAFEKALHAEIMGAAKDLGRDRNRQAFGDGTGIIAIVNGQVSGGTVVTLKNCFNLSDTAAQINVSRFFAAGQILAFVTTGGAVDAVGVVASVNVAANQITLTGSASITNGDYVCRVSTSGSTAIGDTGYGAEIMGLSGMVDDGTQVATYQGVARATYPIMDAGVVDLGGGALSLATMQQLFDLVDQRSDGELTVGFWHHATRLEYLNLLVAAKRFNDERALKPDLGWKGGLKGNDIMFDEIPLVADRDCPYGRLSVMDESQFFRYIAEEGKFADLDGRILLRVTGVDAYEGRYRIYDNLQYDAPNCAGLLKNIGLSSTPTAAQLL
jgi:hypothetical protein